MSSINFVTFIDPVVNTAIHSNTQFPVSINVHKYLRDESLRFVHCVVYPSISLLDYAPPLPPKKVRLDDERGDKRCRKVVKLVPHSPTKMRRERTVGRSYVTQHGKLLLPSTTESNTKQKTGHMMPLLESLSHIMTSDWFNSAVIIT